MRPLWQRSSFLSALVEHNRHEIDQLERSVRFRVGRALTFGWRRPWRWWSAASEIVGALADGRAAHFDAVHSALATTPAGAYPDDGDGRQLSELRRRNAELVAQIEAIEGSRAFAVGSALAERRGPRRVLNELSGKRARNPRAQPRFEPPVDQPREEPVAVAACGPAWFTELMAAGWPVVAVGEADLVVGLGGEDCERELQRAGARGQTTARWDDFHFEPAIAPEIHNPIGWWQGTKGARADFEGRAPEHWRRAFDAARGLYSAAGQLDQVFADLPIAEISVAGPWGERARRVAIMRAIHERHTVGHRIRRLCVELGLPVPELEPLVAVVVCSNRPENLARVVANLARLDYPRLEVGFVAHGAGFDLGPLVELCQERGYPLRHTRAPESLNIGQVRQLSHELSSGTWLAKLDDDDHYGPGYVRDGVWQARMGSAAMVVKGAPIVEFGGESRLQAAPVTRHFRYLMSPGAGGMLLRRDVALGIGVRPVERWEDRGLVLDFARAGMPILCSDPFNYVYRRGRAGGHNWELERSEVIAAMSLEVAGENLRAGDFCF